MIKKEITIAGKRCFVFADEEPEVLLLEPMDLHDLDFLDKEIETLKAGTARPFALGIGTGLRERAFLPWGSLRPRWSGIRATISWMPTNAPPKLFYG